MKKNLCLVLCFTLLLSVNLVCSADGIPQFCRFCGEKIPTDSKFCPYCGENVDFSEASSTLQNAPAAVSDPALSSGHYVGETVKIGSYKTDEYTDALITWKILNITGSTALLISEYCLDCIPYSGNVFDQDNWSTSYIRDWLNSTFYNSAFTDEDKGVILVSDIVNEDNPKYGTDGGIKTRDTVFLLSIQEAENYFEDDSSRIAKATRYAVEQGVKTFTDGTAYWWLRSPGRSDATAAVVMYDGWILSDGRTAAGNCTDEEHIFDEYNAITDIGVRPCIYIDLNML